MVMNTLLKNIELGVDMIERAKISREELQLQAEDNKKAVKELHQQLLAALDSAGELDEDGYPTDEALDVIEHWPWDDPKGWFEFIHSIWHLRSWGWNECDAIDDVTGKKAYCYYISTAGWSGNESIISAMQKNEFMWHLNWVQSRRGGHYIFELREFDDEK